MGGQPESGGSPQASSRAVIPNDQMSAEALCPSACSNTSGGHPAGMRGEGEERGVGEGEG